jgi:very-short-patch-repair endonuclease/transposase-like protein
MKKMSWHEALEDGILIEEDSKKNKCYYPPCHICGTPVYSWSYNRGAKYTCEECRAELVRQSREEGRAISADKKQKKLEDAIKRISKVAKISLYEKAILLVRNSLYKHGWYQSTEEIMVALELIRRGVKAHHQVRIFNYTVDFILPEMKVALEIDGKIFHGKDQLNYQTIRDDAIIYKLGDGWELIRISTENINVNVTKLIPAINTVLKRRTTEKEDSKRHIKYS